MAQRKDEGHEKTDKIIEQTEKKLAKQYKQAEKELNKKLKEFTKKFKAEDEDMRQKLADGEITKDYYQKWRMTRMLTSEHWKDMRDTMAEDLANVNGIARSTINGHTADVYALNRNYATYQVESDARIDTSFTLYNRRGVENLINNKENLLPAPKEGSDAWIAMHDKDLRWNQQKINSSLIQGILQGDSIPQIADRLLNVVGMNEVSAMRSARTMMTGVQNKARDDAYQELKEKGVELETQWVSTLDDRTRHSHRQLHGEVRDEKTGKYSNGLRYPGDPAGEPGEVYNCRCTEISHVKDFPVDMPKWSPKMTMDFDEWQDVHEEMDEQVQGEQASQDEQKPWNAVEFIRDNNMELNDLLEMVPYEDYRVIYDELMDSGMPNRESAREYFEKFINGTYENEKLRELLQDRTNMEMLSDRGYKVLDDLRNSSISANSLIKLDNPKDFLQFVNDVGGGDLTSGSCSSLSFCYVANYAGYDVRDFRGGDSMDWFSKVSNIDKIAKMKGVESTVIRSNKPIKDAVELLKKMPMNMPHILGAGAHAAIVEHTEDGYRYLELQSPAEGGNGWHKLTSDTLKVRFGATKTSSWGSIIDLIDVDSLSKNKYFSEIMAYINTDEGKQKKGSRGRLR